jgi:DNA-binding beta-propeller fold protein YncE
MSSKMTRRRGIPTLAWMALIAALTGAGVLIEGCAPRAAWAQVEVFVTNYLGDSVTTYSRTARGFRVPLRIIGGPATGLLAPAGIAVDTVNNEILVANISSITVYSLTANGDAAPLRTISGDATGLAQPIGLAVDTMRNEILVANASSITVYGRTANGNVAPLRTITGPSTGLLNPAGLAVDTVHNEILVANIGSTTANSSSVTVYGRTANGNAAPLRVPISGVNTKLTQPIGLAVDTARNEVLVANQSAITVYNRTAGGNIAPLRTIAGESTELAHPLGVGIDVLNDEVLVANLDSDTVTVYSRTATGNAGPLRVIETELDGPAFPLVAATCPSVFDFDFSANAYMRCFRDLVRGDEITAGVDLGGTGHTSLNVKGSTGSTPTTWLTVYDATPATPAGGPIFGAQTLCADILTVPFNNIKGAGLVALLNEGPGKKGLALVIHEAGNTDTLFLATVDGDPSKKGKMTTLASISLEEGISGKSWYRLIMTVDPAGPTVTGKVFRHSTPEDPNSALGVQVAGTLTYSPAMLPAGVASTGENGIAGSSINAVLNVSLTNFSNNTAQCGP